MINKIICLLFLFNAVLSSNAQSLKGITLGDLYVSKTNDLKMWGIADVFNSTVSGIHGIIGISTTKNNSVFKISFSPTVVNSTKNVFLSKEAVDSFLENIEDNYNISFNKEIVKHPSWEVLDYNTSKDGVFYHFRSIREEKGSNLWRIYFSMMDLKLYEDLQREEKESSKKDF